MAAKSVPVCPARLHRNCRKGIGWCTRIPATRSTSNMIEPMAGNKLISKRNALLLMVLVTLIWSANGLLIKLVSWSPMSISGLRSLFALAVLLPFLGRPRHLVSFDTLAGGLGFAGALITFVIATKLTTAANAIFLQLTAPIYVALLSGWILGERVRTLDWVITGIIISGMLLFFGDNLTV
ncbi:DMT family transporter, partial [Desulfosarcina sp.]|uniref:DMT family transporter n=1 Tax=Desulfosarcina sp. TaxID=2027861 RepID=UPI0029C08DB3